MTHPRKQHQASAMRRATPHEGEKRKVKKNGDSSSITRLDLLGLVEIEKKMNPINNIIFVLFDKYCPIVDQLGSKDSSCDFQLNCVISYFFTYIYYFMHRSKD
jgi:hypothetical protein